MEIILNLDITKLNNEQKRLLGQITDKAIIPLKSLTIKAEKWEQLTEETPEYLKARAKWKITN